MPILEIKGLPQKDPKKIKIALKKVTMAIAETYGCKPNQVWATWEELTPGYYFEGSTCAEIQPDHTHPPIAKLTCFEGKSPLEIEKTLKVAANTLSVELGIPNNIFMTFQEALSGRVISGNGIVRK